jgi:FkbM family methyltransferase
MINIESRLYNLKNNENFTPKKFLDVGANIGDYSKMIKNIWNDTDIFMIEANPYNETYLKNTGYDYIISLLTDKIGDIYDFYLNKTDLNSTGCSIYRENTQHFSDQNLDIIKLKSNTLDNLFEDQKFDLIKLDTQGSEIDILKGGLNLIRKSQYIILETSLIDYNLNSPLIGEVLNFMKSINYEMVDVIELHYLGNVLSQIDILFKNNKSNMITIIQVDKNYKQNSNYDMLVGNLEKMSNNNNKYNLCIDIDAFNKNDGHSYTKLKIIKLLDILKKYDDDEIIMYIDAFDTSVDSTDNEIKEKFLKLDVDVLYSTEKNCWPVQNFNKFYSNEHFLNSGTIIFKNKKYQQILEMLIEIDKARLEHECDQFYHTIFNLIHSVDVKIKLDDSNEIFQCLWGESEDNFEKVGNKIKNKTTNTFPCVFHGNGNGKDILKKLFNYEKKTVSFLNFTEDKMGINFMNSNYDKLKVYAEIKNIRNQVIFSDNLELTYNICYFIHTGIKDDYIFTIYNMNSEILLQEKNF